MNPLPRLQQRLSDRVHARGDVFAQQAGWTTTKTTGRFGFGARVYRDPRFGQRQAEAARAGLRAPRPGGSAPARARGRPVMAPSAGEGKPSAHYAVGYRLGLADARTGGITFICGGPQAAEKAAGYRAGLAAGRRERHAGPEHEAGS